MEYRKRNFSRPRIGQQLGNYRLVHLLGRGSFADVYLGEHIHLKTEAAIKVLDMRLTNDDMQDFLKEARTIARLKHPSIIQVLEFGMEDNTPFLVMDYAPNGTLRSHLPKGSRFPPEDIQPYVMQVASALQYAHDEKLIHRDIKPENMLLGINDEVLLADFGIAVVAHSSRTQSMQGVAGTVAYMAPEQLRGMPVKSSDQYALAAVIYEWLTGSSPFRGSFVEVATHHTLTSPPLLREQVPTTPPMDEAAHYRSHIASASDDGTVQIWEAMTGRKVHTYRGHSGGVSTIAWSPDGKWIASAGTDGTVQVWAAENMGKVCTYTRHSEKVNALAWSPTRITSSLEHGYLIASASADSTVQIWDSTTAHRLFVYRGHAQPV